MNEQIDRGQATIDQHILDLLNGSIDGEISATEQDELDSLLASSPVVRSLNDELRAVTRILDELPELEPPNTCKRLLRNRSDCQCKAKPIPVNLVFSVAG